MICKILGLFANTLTADDKYSLLKRENLTEPIQMQLSNKQKNFFRFFFGTFFKSRSNFEHLEKKDNPLRPRVTEITDWKRRG